MVYFKRLTSSGFVSLEAFKMYYVMRTFAPSLHRKSTDFLILEVISFYMNSDIFPLYIYILLTVILIVVFYYNL